MMLTFTSGQTVGAQRCAMLFAVDDPLIEDDEILNILLAASPSDEHIVRFTAEKGVATVAVFQDLNDSVYMHIAINHC